MIGASPLGCIPCDFCGSAVDRAVDAASTEASDEPGRDAGNAARDGGAPDVTLSPVDAGVLCETARGKERCPVPAEACCLVYVGGVPDHCFSNAGGACRADGGRAVALTCDDDLDCEALGAPTSICCGETDTGGFTAVTCKPLRACLGQHMCDPAKPACGAGERCQTSPTLPAYSSCRQ
jgi:hypothetical protein